MNEITNMHSAHICNAIFNTETIWFVFVLWDKTASDPKECFAHNIKDKYR